MTRVEAMSLFGLGRCGCGERVVDAFVFRGFRVGVIFGGGENSGMVLRTVLMVRFVEQESAHISPEEEYSIRE